MPRAAVALAKLYRPGATGLIFKPGSGQDFFSYREIQYRYDQALKAAKLPYSATHILRKAGTSRTFNQTKGDMDIAAQQLGNSDMKNIRVYAKRSSFALRHYAKGEWEDFLATPGGRKWSQELEGKSNY